MKKLFLYILLPLVSLFLVTPKSNQISLITNKSVRLVDDEDNYEPNDEEPYYEDDYEYDGFFEQVFESTNMNQEEDFIEFDGYTNGDYGSFPYYLSFDLNELLFTYTFDAQDIEVDCNTAYVDDLGRLDANINIYSNETEELYTFKISDYRDIYSLVDLALNGIEIEEKEIILPASGFWSFLGKVIAAIVVIYVVVAETAEQIRAIFNYKYNLELEFNGEGVFKGNYITNQKDSENEGYKSADYHFGFTTFYDTGCEVASIYNLMIARDNPQMLSKVIYQFEHWAIEFAVAWGYFSSNPYDIYRYLRAYSIRYVKFKIYFFFKWVCDWSANDRDFIMSTWNKEIEAGLHTYYFRKIDKNILRTYNFDLTNSFIDYEYLDEIYQQTTMFLVGYRIL